MSAGNSIARVADRPAPDRLWNVQAVWIDSAGRLAQLTRQIEAPSGVAALGQACAEAGLDLAQLASSSVADVALLLAQQKQPG